MMITRRTARPFGTLHDEMNRIFNELGAAESRRSTVPAMDISGDEHAYFVEVEVPGFTMDNLDISFHDGELVVAGSVTSDVSSDDASESEGTHETNERADVTESSATSQSTSTTTTTYFRRERRVESFSRTVRVPADVDAEGIEATLEHGLLRITLPKAEQARPRKIQVRQG